MTPFPRFLNIEENTALKQAVDQFQKLFNASKEGMGTGFYFSYNADLSVSQ